MEHPSVIKLQEHAQWRAEGMGKSTVFESPRLMVGLNAFEPGQSHTLHAHADMDKVYQVVEGRGCFLLEGRSVQLAAGEMLIAPAGVPHGVVNDSDARLLVMVVLAPGPRKG